MNMSHHGIKPPHELYSHTGTFLVFTKYIPYLLKHKKPQPIWTFLCLVRWNMQVTKQTDSYKNSLLPFNWKGNKTYKTKYRIHCHFVVQNYITLQCTFKIQMFSDIHVLLLVHIIILQLKKRFIFGLQLAVKPVTYVARVFFYEISNIKLLR